MRVSIPLESETLTPEEIAEITGRDSKAHQVQWLRDNDWKFVRNAAGQPIVGRLYARFKLAGVDLSLMAPEVTLPDFSKVL